MTNRTFSTFDGVNEKGLEYLQDAINSYCKDPDNHIVSAYAEDIIACTDYKSDGAYLELSRHYTKDGNPFVIDFDEDMCIFSEDVS